MFSIKELKNMRNNLEKAIYLLKKGNYTLAAVSGNDTITSDKRGVKPLLEMLDEKKHLHGFSIADKVIGKAAAYLYVLLEADEIYTNVISRPALDILKNHAVNVEYGILTEAIRNRDNTGFCPMETAVMNAESPDEALRLIREKLRQLTG